MHIHDEVVIEVAPNMSLDAVCEQMGRTPPWAEGLILEAAGYITHFYKRLIKTSDFPLCRGYLMKTTSFALSR